MLPNITLDKKFFPFVEIFWDINEGCRIIKKNT